MAGSSPAMPPEFCRVPALRCTAEEALHRVRDTMGALSQRRIDRVRIFLLEPRDQFGGRQNPADAADALSAAPDFLPGFGFGALAGRIGAEAHFRDIGFGEV